MSWSGGGTPRLLLEGVPAPHGDRIGLNFPVLSPDGSKIAYLNGSGDHDNSLRVMDADGSHVRVLLPDTGVMRGAVIGGLAWSPDGSQLAFGTGFSPDRIWLVNADGTGLHRRSERGVAQLVARRHPDRVPEDEDLLGAGSGSRTSTGRTSSRSPSRGPVRATHSTARRDRCHIRLRRKRLRLGLHHPSRMT